MLPSPHRLTAPTDFREVVRRGRRQGRPRLVVHLKVPTEPVDRPVTAGFVVSKAVGGAVVRNQVKRRLRHLVAERLATVPPGSQIVVRALPPAASSTYAELGHDLDGALGRLAPGPAGSAGSMGRATS